MGASPVDRLRELGARLDRRWRAENYREEVFPALAADGLAESSPEATPQEVIDWALDTDPLPPQPDLEAHFGQPPLTVYENDRFRVDVLFWLHHSTPIHEHTFQGAFAPLYGSSIHSRYSFRQEAELAPDTFLGTLRHEHLERLEPGDVRQIVPGTGLIHSVEHLTVPTLNLVVRTPRPIGPARSQLTYLRSGLAVAPFHRPPGRVRRFQLLAALARFGDRDELVETLCHCLAEADVGTAVLCLLRHSELLLDPDSSARIFDRLRLEERVEQALLREAVFRRREHYLHRRRRRLTDPDLRFFLTLLAQLPTRRAILDEVQRHDPTSPPARRIVDWLRRIGAMVADRYGRRSGSPKGLDASLDDGGLWVLQRVLEGASEAEVLDRLDEAPPELELDEAAARAALALIPKLWALYPLVESEEARAVVPRAVGSGAGQ